MEHKYGPEWRQLTYQQIRFSLQHFIGRIIDLKEHDDILKKFGDVYVKNATDFLIYHITNTSGYWQVSCNLPVYGNVESNSSLGALQVNEAKAWAEKVLVERLIPLDRVKREKEKQKRLAREKEEEEQEVELLPLAERLIKASFKQSTLVKCKKRSIEREWLYLDKNPEYYTLSAFIEQKATIRLKIFIKSNDSPNEVNIIHWCFDSFGLNHDTE